MEEKLIEAARMSVMGHMSFDKFCDKYDYDLLDETIKKEWEECVEVAKTFSKELAEEVLLFANIIDILQS